MSLWPSKDKDPRPFAERFKDGLDPAFAGRRFSVADLGTSAPMRTVEREWLLIRTTEALLLEQQRTNALLEQLVRLGGRAESDVLDED